MKSTLKHGSVALVINAARWFMSCLVGLLLLNCEKATTPKQQKAGSDPVVGLADLPDKPDDVVVKEYLRASGENRVTLSTEAKEISLPEKHVLVWLIRELHKSAPANTRHYQFRFSKTEVGSPQAYAVNRLAKLNPSLIRPNTSYIEVQFFPINGLACPEYFGVVDIETLKLLHTWKEGP